MKDALICCRQPHHFNAYCDIVFERVSELYRIRVFLEKSVVDDVGWEGYRGQAHSAEFILPVADFFGCEFKVCVFDVVETGRDVLDFDSSYLEGGEFYEITLEGELFWVGVDDLDDHFGVGRVLQFSFNKSGDSQRRFYVIDGCNRTRGALQVEFIQNLSNLGIDEANRTFLLTHF